MTLVPGFQYFFGRYRTWVSENHRQVPVWAGEEVTWRFFSNSFLFLTGTSKVSTTGMPIPTLLPVSGYSVG